MEETVLELKNISYKYPGSDNWALKELNFSIARGSFSILAGPTGSGKSTILLLARGFAKEYSGDFEGQIFVHGQDIKERTISELGSKIGIVFQNPALQLHQLRVIDEVMSAPMYQGLPYKECLNRARSLTDKILGPSFDERSPNDLSSGQQQKVALAAALSMKADILLLDEPFSFLDNRASQELLWILLGLKEKGKTIILATHSLEGLIRYSDQIVLIDKGRKILEGSPREVLYDPRFEKVLTPPLSVLVGKRLNKKVLDWSEIIKNETNLRT